MLASSQSSASPEVESARPGEVLSKRGNPKLERHLLYKKVRSIGVEDCLFFPIRPDETVPLARARICSFLLQDKEFRYQCRKARYGVFVIKAGRWDDPKPLLVGREQPDGSPDPTEAKP